MSLRNLAEREADNGRIRVSLDWESVTNTLLVTAEDSTGRQTHSEWKSGREALFAYAHPFALAQKEESEFGLKIFRSSKDS